MSIDTRTRRAFELAAVLLDYPHPGLEQAARECAALVISENPMAAQSLYLFADWVAARAIGEVEEIYTRLFELNPICALHIGYHLFGESYKRSLFMLGLKERYQAEGFDAGSELPDHLAVMLRFCARSTNEAAVDELLREAILPVLDKLVILPDQDMADDQVEKPDVPGGYALLLQSLKQIIASRVALSPQLEASLC